MINLKHSNENASWVQCPSKKFTICGYSGAESIDAFCNNNLKNHHLLIDDDDYDNNDADFDSSN